MTFSERMRDLVFCLGLCAIALSIGLIAGIYNRPIDTQDYMEQAMEGVPWVLAGLISSIAGAVLSYVGKPKWKLIAVGLGGLLSGFWLLQAGMLI